MMRCAIRENKALTLRRFCKGLKDNFRKEVRLIGGFTLDQAYTVVQDYELLVKSQWIKCQNPRITPFRSQFRNDGFLLGAPSYRLNLSGA